MKAPKDIMDSKAKMYGMHHFFWNKDKHKKEKLYREIVTTLVENDVLEIFTDTDGVKTIYHWRICARKYGE